MENKKMKPKYLSSLIEESYSSFARMKSGIRTTGLVAIVGAMLGVGVYGCKKEEPKKEETSSPKSVSLKEELYEQTKIAFVSNRDGNFEIYVMNADGSKQKRLTNNPGFDGVPSWSPDGKEIAFASDRDRNHEIYVMNADGSAQKRLTSHRAIKAKHINHGKEDPKHNS
jgi:hypothetical protein